MVAKYQLFVSCLIFSILSVGAAGQSVSLPENQADSSNAGVEAVSGNFLSPSELAIFRALPQNSESLISDSDIIIIGDIEGTGRRFAFYGYDEEIAEHYKAMEATTPFQLGTPVVEYDIKVNKVLMGSIANDESTITLMLIDTNTDLPNHRQMFFLTLTPDNTNYGITTSMDIIKMQDQKLTFSHLGVEHDINFTRGLNANQFELNVQSKLSELCNIASENAKFCR